MERTKNKQQLMEIQRREILLPSGGKHRKDWVSNGPICVLGHVNNKIVVTTKKEH